MGKRIVSLPRDCESLDLVSHGRCGPPGTLHLSTAQVEQVQRTVRRTPEVMVKVSGGARDLGGAKAHFDYIDRHGKLDIELDDGRRLQGKAAGKELVEDWNLVLSSTEHGKPAGDGQRDRRPKLSHHIVLSMPARTPPQAVLAAAKKFARERFALQHRYALVLHTDQGHPHVHLVVKAEREFEPGRRLHITKPMLREWREAFAACMRQQGVAANASSAWARARPRHGKKDPIHHRLRALRDHAALPPADRVGRAPPVDSTFMRRKVNAVAAELKSGGLRPEAGKDSLLEGRQALEAGWRSVAAALRDQGDTGLAAEVDAFVSSLPPVRTEKETIAAGLRTAAARARRQQDLRHPPSEDAQGERGRDE
jgi:hypothetical protein